MRPRYSLHERGTDFEQLLSAVPQIPSAPIQEAHSLPVAGAHPMPATGASQSWTSGNPDLGLVYKHPKTHHHEAISPSMTMFSDASLSPSGGKSQSGCILQLTHHEAKPHLLHWFSGKQKIIASRDSCLSHCIPDYSELYVIVPFTHSPNLRCDNQAVLAMLDSPTWRSRHTSMRGEAVRTAKIEGQRDKLL
eukprot:6490629-Amphidinium_carterae.2